MLPRPPSIFDADFDAIDGSAGKQVIETHGVYMAITPSATRMASDPEVRRAVEYNEKWGGLHISVTTFALRQANAHLKKLVPALSVHGGSIVDVVKRAAALASTVNGWHPSERNQLSRKEFKSGKRAIFIKSDFLDDVGADARRSGLANVTKDGGFHVTIGPADYAALETMLLDRDTRFTIGIPVREGDRVVRIKNVYPLWR